MHRSTRWAAASLRRAEQRRTANEQAAATDPSTTFTTEQSANWEQLAPILDQALDSLNAQDRDAVLLRYFNNHPFVEIGAKLGLSENAARMRVEHALAVGLTVQAIQNRNLQEKLTSPQSQLATSHSASASSRYQVALLETKRRHLDEDPPNSHEIPANSDTENLVLSFSFGT